MDKTNVSNIALFINGVFKQVLKEIHDVQLENPEKVLYLQPYKSQVINLLKNYPPTTENPIPLYLSLSNDLNRIHYVAEIVQWEHKQEMDLDRIDFVEKAVKKYQPKEGGLYQFNEQGNPCVNLLSITHLVELKPAISVTELVKVSDNSPLKERTRSGGWSPVYRQPFINLEGKVFKEQFEKEFEEQITRSSKDSSQQRLKRLALASKKPEKFNIVSTGFKRNPDVVAEVLSMANGICDLCGQPAPFHKSSDGSPYLEVHHWIPLAEGGEDTLDNASALCPNCHKNAHFGIHKNYIMENKKLPG